MRKFDLKFEGIIDRMFEKAKQMFPNRNWRLEIQAWDDTDYRIQLKSSWGSKIDVFDYQKSRGAEILYYQEDLPMYPPEDFIKDKFI